MNKLSNRKMRNSMAALLGLTAVFVLLALMIRPLQATVAAQGSGPQVIVKDITGTVIADGDKSPSPGKGTDFGSVEVNSASGKILVFAIGNLGDADLNLTGTPKVSISGAAVSDFTVTVAPTSPVVPAGETGFAIRFTPSANGLRHATVSIANNDADANPYTFAIQGTGTDQPEPHISITAKDSGTLIPNGQSPPIGGAGYFGSVAIGSSLEQSFQVHNSGTADLNLTGTPKVWISGAAASDFTVTVEPAGTVAPNADTVFTIRFTPSAQFNRSATVSIGNNDPKLNPYYFAIGGDGTPTPKPHIVVSGNNHGIANGDSTPSVADNTDFGSTISSVEQTFKITNFGDADLNLTGTPKVSISGAAASDFTVITQPGSPLAPGHNSPFTIRFTPSANGLRHATVSIANNAADANPYTFAIQGTGTGQPEPHISITAKDSGTLIPNGQSPPIGGAGYFGSVAIGSSLEQSFQVHNSGTADLNLTGTPKVWISGAAASDFTVTVEPAGTVAPNADTVFTIRFTPSAQFNRSATVSIGNNDPKLNPYYFAIGGDGTPTPKPHIVVSGNNHGIANGDSTPSVADNTDFGSTISSVEQTFKITNFGDADLNLTGTPKVSISGAAASDFTVITQPGSPLAPGHNSPFTIRFTPSANGLRHATVSIANNAADNNPYTFAIQGQNGLIGLIAGGGNPKSAVTVGAVSVQIGDGSNDLFVVYEITEPGWCLTEAHAHVASLVDLIPQTKKGNPQVGKFDYFDTNIACQMSYSFGPISLSGVGSPFVVAAHAVVQNEHLVRTETAWGAGTPFPGKNWATYIEVTGGTD
jgi:hypothetical protein